MKLLGQLDRRLADLQMGQSIQRYDYSFGGQFELEVELLLSKTDLQLWDRSFRSKIIHVMSQTATDYYLYSSPPQLFLS
jgi:hypothetical protein